jgi:hypothetical protein
LVPSGRVTTSSLLLHFGHFIIHFSFASTDGLVSFWGLNFPDSILQFDLPGLHRDRDFQHLPIALQ